MTHPDESRLAAYVDGELPPHEAAKVEALLERDPSAAARVERLRAMRDRLAHAYAPITEEPVPDRLRALLETPGTKTAEAAQTAEAEVVDLSAARASRTAHTAPPRRTFFRLGAREAGLMAACLAVGFVVATSVRAPQGGALIAQKGSGLYASAGLDRALTRNPSGDDGAIRIGLSFKDDQGRWCRTFATDAKAAFAGLACRTNGRWSVETLTRPEAAPGKGGYRMAASATAPEILAAVDARIAGEPLDADAEAAALKRGWRD